MKTLLPLLFLLASVAGTYAQNYAGLKRLQVDSALAPFYHGVASGDPLDDAVIIWTRITVEDSLLSTFDVHWEMATDTGFTALVDSGTVSTDNTKDYTIKHDVTGLQPFTYYYYRFRYDGKYSITGRTKTAPDTQVPQLRFAVVSCSRYSEGYFNVYQSIADRNDVDAVIHLGDYIYEYAGTGNARQNEPPTEIISLSDYRTRYAHYHLDPQLRAIHQQYPFINIWDDHETANNSWTGGAQNHTPGTEGNWADRVDNAMTALYEWLPIREHVPNDYKGYRAISYGPLAKVIVLETRLDGRDEQTSDAGLMADTSRHMISPTQMNWLRGELSDTTHQWKIIANQVMMAPLTLAGNVLNTDQWDDYQADRQRIYDHILNNDIDDVVVLTGDIHTAWANNLESNSTPVAVEFVTTSVTSPSDGIPSFVTPQLIYGALSHVKFVDLTQRGYYILDVTPQRTQADYYYVNTIANIDPSTNYETSWKVVSTTRTLSQGSESHAGDTTTAVPQPQFTGSPDQMLILGAYPNPVSSELLVQVYVPHSENLSIKVFDLTGREVLHRDLSTYAKGVNYINLNFESLPSGDYILTLTDGEQIFKRRVVKTP